MLIFCRSIIYKKVCCVILTGSEESACVVACTMFKRRGKEGSGETQFFLR